MTTTTKTNSQLILTLLENKDTKQINFILNKMSILLPDESDINRILDFKENANLFIEKKLYDVYDYNVNGEHRQINDLVTHIHHFEDGFFSLKTMQIMDELPYLGNVINTCNI